jgi:glycosyltransferase involved in cell wall biosynthesis
LLLFFTDGVSLQTWNKVGILERELALYKKLSEQGVSTGFVTYGDQEDLIFKNQMPSIDIHANSMNFPDTWYRLKLEWLPPKADIYKSNQVSGSLIALRAAQRTGAKFLARCGYLLSEFEEKQSGVNSLKAISARQLERTVFRSADLIEITTVSAADRVMDMYTIDRTKIRVIPNYVETGKFLYRQKRNVKGNRILAIGRLEEQKNFKALIHALAPLDVKFTIIGEGSQRDELEAASRDGTAKIQLLGNVPNNELPAILNESDLFILPSLYEGHPKALLEAMACGLPVIGTRVAGIQEIIRDGENGILCDTDPESIREAASKLLDDVPLRQRLGDAARRFVGENFSLEKVLEMELSLIEELMAGTSAKS